MNFGLNGRRFAVLGRAGLDLYPDPPGTAIEDALSFTAALGGSSGNIAAGLARLGGEVSIIGCVSDDAVGRFTRKQLEAYGIDATHMNVVRGEARNTLALSESRTEGHETVIYRNKAADFELTDTMVAGVDFGRFDALIATGTSLAADPSRSATLAAFRAAKLAGALVIFDIDYRPYSWPDAETAARVYKDAAELSDAIIGNDVEFGFMAGGAEKGEALAASLGKAGKFVVYKMGGDGARTFVGNEIIETGIFPVLALKPVGAGDSFMAGLLTGLAKGLNIKQAVLRGSACAAIVVSKVGCAPAMPTPDELDRFLATHPGPTEPKD